MCWKKKIKKNKSIQWRPITGRARNCLVYEFLITMKDLGYYERHLFLKVWNEFQSKKLHNRQKSTVNRHWNTAQSFRHGTVSRDRERKTEWKSVTSGTIGTFFSETVRISNFISNPRENAWRFYCKNIVNIILVHRRSCNNAAYLSNYKTNKNNKKNQLKTD